MTYRIGTLVGVGVLAGSATAVTYVVVRSFRGVVLPTPPYDIEADLTGKTYIVTGATGAIGRELVERLAEKNARVIMAHRNQEKCTEIRRDVVLFSRNKEVFCRRCDLSDFESIQKFVNKLYEDGVTRVDGLVNGAAVITPGSRHGAQGIDYTLAVNHLGPFLLTGLLLEKMLNQNEPSRIVFVNTVAASKHKEELNLNRLFSSDDRELYRAFDAYKFSKLASLLFARELSEKLKDTKISVVAVDPGKHRSSLFSQMWYQTLRPARLILRAADYFMEVPSGPRVMEPVLHAVLGENVKSGSFISPNTDKEEDLPWGLNADNDSLRQKLWLLSEQWTNISSCLSSFKEEMEDPQSPLKQESKNLSSSHRSWRALWLW